MSDPPRSGDLPPGYDEEDPYENLDLDDLPRWWRENVKEFREYGMRPYRPSRFDDGVLAPKLISELEEEYDISIEIRAKNPKVEDKWILRINEKRIAPIPRRRDGDGYTVYEIKSKAFDNMVKCAINST